MGQNESPAVRQNSAREYKFLFSRTWFGYFVLALILALICVGLGKWQLSRRDAVVANITRIEHNYDATPQSLSATFDPFARFAKQEEWTQVALKGQYDDAHSLLVRNRPLNGKPGFLQLVPFRTSDGENVIVSRGWLAPSDQSMAGPASIPAPPSGPMTVVVRVRPSEPTVSRGAPAGQLASINLKEYAAQLPYPLAKGAYGQVVSEDPVPSGGMLPQQPKPSIEEGPNLSYAYQWFAFAVLMFVGYGYAAYATVRNARLAREYEREQERGPVHQAVKLAPRPKRRSSKPSAEDVEDAMLDAQGFR